MKIKKISLVALSILAIILEALPYGAVLVFATETEKLRKTFSYFNPISFGYANFGPFLTAFLTIVLLVLTLVFLFKHKKTIKYLVVIVSAVSVLTSVLPLIQMSEYTILAGIITVVLLAITVISMLIKNKF